MRRALWALLLRHHDMTLQAAGRTIDDAGLLPVVSALSRAIESGLPESSKESAGGTSKPWRVADTLEAAIRTGLTPSEFWRLTPRETAVQAKAFDWKRREAQALVWYSAAYQRMKRLPSLTRILGRGRARAVRTESQMKLVTKMMAASGVGTYHSAGT